jgi:hypothetical protein
MIFSANRRFGSSFALALLFVWLLPEPVCADEPRWLELTWRAPAECPAGAEIEREIGRLVGTGARERGTLRAVVDVSGSDEQGWRARVQSEYGGDTGERTLEGATCRAVARAAALVISLTVDSNADRLEGREPSTPREPEAVPRATSAPQVALREPLRWWVALGPRSEVGLLRHPGFGLELAIGARMPLGSIEIAGAAYLPDDTTVPGTAAGGRFRLLTIEARACPHIAGGAFEFFVCGSAGLGRLSAEGFGVTSPGSAATMLGFFGLGPGMGLFLTRAFRLTLGIDGTFAPGHASFVLDNFGHVHTASRLGGSARIELAFYP